MKKQKMPAVFVTDFGPLPAVETDAYTQALGKLGQTLSKPKAIVIMSGHWETDGQISVTSAKKPGVVHDFTGFPDKFYKLDYPCPGDPALAKVIVKLLKAGGIPAKTDAKRPLDHGAWVPLSRLYPKADIPVLQITAPAWHPRTTFEIGEILLPLRDKGVLLIGAGAISHNLRLAMSHQKDDAPDRWALDLDAWISEKLAKGDVDAILNYRALAPSSSLAAPTPEHFNPLFFVLGAAAGEPLPQFYSGIAYGNGLMKIITSPVS